MAATKSAVLLVALALSLPVSAHGFQPLFSFEGNSFTHRDITQRAILWKAIEVCRAVAVSEGRDVTLVIDESLTAFKVQQACSGTGNSLLSTVMFQTTIAKMYLSNAAVDVVFPLSKDHHFDDESFQGGRDVITAGMSAVKASVKLKNFVSGRLTLGRICHTLQDFYSHSNWVELGNTSPYSALIRPDQPLENLAGAGGMAFCFLAPVRLTNPEPLIRPIRGSLATAGKGTMLSSAAGPGVPTCRNCAGGDCTNNLLPDVLQQGLLTSGYFNVFSPTKPEGKCSHGSMSDWTSQQAPVGGINKDDTGASHGFLHHKAADLAVNATMELLENIRVSVGDKNFLRLMGLSQSPVLCFVIDTTGSMSDDIAEAKRVSFSIIDTKRGTEQEPSAYILVPFNDPGFGPLTITTDADVFKDSINELTASGGGDVTELCLSGLQLALTTAPASSEIFVFTDAPAKDSHLKRTVTALIESTKSVVTFMLTDVLSGRRRRRQAQGMSPRTMSQADPMLYRELAQISGGQAIEVIKSSLSLATAIIEESSASSVVTVFQAVRNPGKPDNFTFTFDSSMRNLTAYITGASSLSFSLKSPSGTSQSSHKSSGTLGSFSTVGNLRRFSFSTDNQTGLWEVSVTSDNPYSIKVIGQSSVNFIYNLVEAYEGAHADFILKEGRPLIGGNASLLVSVTGSDTTKVTEVVLLESSGSREVNGSVRSVGGSAFLVTFQNVPEGEFVVRLRGEDLFTSRSTTTASGFQRQASTQIKTSSISVTAQANNTSVEPGSTISISFTISSTSNGMDTGTYTVRATNDRGYTSGVSVGSRGGITNGTVTLTVPASASSGTDVTLTMEAESATSNDYNYAVLKLSVVAKVTDVSGPSCEVARVSDICPSASYLCSSTQWQFSAKFTDGVNGTGIDTLTIRQGNGTINTSMEVGAGGENITVVNYSASCCAQRVELLAVDRIGNARTCVGQARAAEAAETTLATTMLATTSTGGCALTISQLLWITMAVF